MAGGYALLFLPMVLGLPFAWVGLILRLCEWGWGKCRGDLGSTSMLAAYGYICSLNLLLVILGAGIAAQLRS